MTPCVRVARIVAMTGWTYDRIGIRLGVTGNTVRKWALGNMQPRLSNEKRINDLWEELAPLFTKTVRDT